ncbi:winged helix-turn-helix domain-containing protein [Aeromonas lacus]
MRKVFKHNDIFSFEPKIFKILSGRKELKLSIKEVDVLTILCEHQMQVVERKKLISEIWNDQESSDIGLNKTILLLRRKFESIGLVDAIETIPRIGYVLRLKIECLLVSDEAEAEQQKSLPRIGIAFFIVTIISVTSALVVRGSHSVTEDYFSTPPNNIKKYQGSTGQKQLLFMGGVSSLVNYNAIFNKIGIFNFYALLSKNAFSIIKIDGSHDIKWRGVYLVNSFHDINSQLSCIIDDINKHSNEYVVRNEKNHSLVYYGDYFSECNGTPRHIGTIRVNSTNTQDSAGKITDVQNVSLKTIDGKVIFDITRAVYNRENSTKTIHYRLGSFNVKIADPDEISNHKGSDVLLNQFTQDNIYHGVINKKQRVYISSAFGGILYTR